MKIIDLPVQKRELTGSAESRRIRREGGIPVNLYGGSRGNVALTTTRDAFGEVLKAHSAIVRLTTGDVKQTALVRDVAWNTFGDHVEHLDLFRVELEDEVKVKVPFHFVGMPKGISHGGETQIVAHDVEIFCAVKDIPSELDCDIADLDVGDAIHVGDFPFPEGIRPAGHESDVVVQVKIPKVAAEEDEGEGEAAGDVEVIGEAPAESTDED